MSTRQGRREHRPGPTDQQSTESIEKTIETLISDFRAEITACLIEGYQGEVSALIQFFDGRISKTQVGRNRVRKPVSHNSKE